MHLTQTLMILRVLEKYEIPLCMKHPPFGIRLPVNSAGFNTRLDRHVNIFSDLF